MANDRDNNQLNVGDKVYFEVCVEGKKNRAASGDITEINESDVTLEANGAVNGTITINSELVTKVPSH